jgi:rRNA biogenesis protein RRP5
VHICTKLFHRSFFKKWLSMEQRIGDEEGVENVKERAIAWTQNAAASSSVS